MQNRMPTEAEINTALRRRAEHHRAWTREHRTEISHRADAYEDKAGINARLNAYVKNIEQTAVLKDVEIIDSSFTLPHFGMVKSALGKVGKKHTERDTDKQQRL